jgi:hypothetical protein
MEFFFEFLVNLGFFYYNFSCQVLPNNQCINRRFTVRQPRCPRHTPDNAEPKPLPDLDRGNVVFEDKVEDGVFVALLYQSAN